VFLGCTNEREQSFLAVRIKKHFTENKRLCYRGCQRLFLRGFRLQLWNLVNIVSLARKRGNTCCENKMFLKKKKIIIRNIFCFSEETFFCVNKMFLKKSDTFFFSEGKMFPQQMFRCAQTGKHVGKHAAARTFLQQYFLV